MQHFLFFSLCCLALGLNAQTNVNLTLLSHVPINEKVANICGYAVDGKEYALVGASCGMIVMDITDPVNPVQIVQVPNVCNRWKEIKVYDHYAYVTTEGEGGALQIVDLANLPSPDLVYQTYTGDGLIVGQLSRVHALHIDTTAGFVYLTGTNIDCVILDINTDPINPTFVGKYGSAYVHDAYVDNDTMFAAEILAGTMRVLDVHDKTNIVELGVVATPNNYPHNVWLTPDKNYALTTDETPDSYLTAYDITDLTDLTEVDRVQSNPGSNSTVHNTHITGDWYAVTSWYNDGVTIVDCSRPHNLVQVGNYDAGPGAGSGFKGTWGVYPFLPSGTVILSNIDEGFFALKPNYERGCYFEGTVVDSLTLDPVFGATVTIIDGEAQGSDNSDTDGSFACGQLQNGTFTISAYKPGYKPYTATILLENGILTALQIKLVRDIGYTMTGSYRCVNGVPISEAKIRTYFETPVGTENQFLDGDNKGKFAFNGYADKQVAYASKWGYGVAIDSLTLPAENHFNLLAQSPDITLPENYACLFVQDYFETDLGWTSNVSWVRAAPLPTFINGVMANPNSDAADFGKDCYVTGNNNYTSTIDEVNELVWLQSPALTVFEPYQPFLATPAQSFLIEFDYWFFSSGIAGDPTNDYLKAFLVLDDQDDIAEPCDTILLLLQQTNTTGWQHASINLSAAGFDQFNAQNCGQITPTNYPIKYAMFVAEDIAPSHVVEAGIDHFEVTVGYPDGAFDNFPAKLRLFPNPTLDESLLTWVAKEPGTLQIIDMAGRVLLSQNVPAGLGSTTIGYDLPAGVYIVQLTGFEAIRFIKL
jgi:choice-of-anchor B domain-containing protein